MRRGEIYLSYGKVLIINMQGGIKMKIIVVCGSPRKDGNTEIMADAFINGAKEQGHEVEKINIEDKKIAPCLGCEYCFSNDGICFQEDDMEEVLEKIDDADMIVFASPIYWFSITAQLKCVIDRLYARARKGFTVRYAALLLNSASDGVYQSAIEMFEGMCSYLEWENKGIVTAFGMNQKGMMQKSPALNRAYELGKSIN